MRHCIFHLDNHLRAGPLLLATVITCWAIGVSQAEEPASSPVGDKVSIEQSQQWAAQLDDDRFDTRQRAQLRLEQTGLPALDAVATIAQTGSLESSTRAINILLQWSESSQQDLRLAALERLSNLSNRPRESAMATRLLANAREQVALEALTKLGARYNRDVQTHGLGNTLQVTFGPQWKGGYEGLKHLNEVPRATTVSLHSTPLNDPVLDHLSQLPALRRVEIYGTDISVASIEKFDQQHPNIKVDVRPGGALLGVRARPQGIIDYVEPDSAADRAGIVRGDRITEFNGEAVANFAALTERIGKQKAGDSATLTVSRQNNTRQVKVTFDQWGKTEINLPAPANQLRIQGQQILAPKLQVERR